MCVPRTMNATYTRNDPPHPPPLFPFHWPACIILPLPVDCPDPVSTAVRSPVHAIHGKCRGSVCACAAIIALYAKWAAMPGKRPALDSHNFFSSFSCAIFCPPHAATTMVYSMYAITALGLASRISQNVQKESSIVLFLLFAYPACPTIPL